MNKIISLDGIGFISYSINENNTAVIENIFINYSKRHNGFGSQLIKTVINRLKEQRINQIHLNISPYDYNHRYNYFKSKNREQTLFSASEYNQKYDQLKTFYFRFGFIISNESVLNKKKIGSLILDL